MTMDVRGQCDAVAHRHSDVVILRGVVRGRRKVPILAADCLWAVQAPLSRLDTSTWMCRGVLLVFAGRWLRLTRLIWNH
jgi:hypothetical protein